ncbi:MAG: tRNA (N6-isopentenyl adenosine(37)-C2)-methylthiotransferase MiaB, partial [Nakamurella sp.]
GSTVEVLVANGEGRKDQGIGRLSGRARDGRLVHFLPTGLIDRNIRPGDVITTTVTYGAPHHLVADSPVLSHRRTRAGDRAEAGLGLKTPGVGLGMPSLGRPAAVPVQVAACGIG